MHKQSRLHLFWDNRRPSSRVRLLIELGKVPVRVLPAAATRVKGATMRDWTGQKVTSIH